MEIGSKLEKVSDYRANKELFNEILKSKGHCQLCPTDREGQQVQRTLEMYVWDSDNFRAKIGKT